MNGGYLYALRAPTPAGRHSTQTPSIRFAQDAAQFIRREREL